MINNKIECINCGNCCHFTIKGKVHRCKHLRTNKDSFYCHIYPRRLGTRISPYHYCTLRVLSKSNYKGCPHNQSEDNLINNISKYNSQVLNDELV